MDIETKTTVSYKIADDMIGSIRKNLQAFDANISMFDVATCMIMACAIVLRIMYEVTMVQALHAVQLAAKSIGVEEKE